MTPHQALAQIAKRKIVSQASSKSYCPHAPTPKQRAFVDFDGLEALYGGAAGGGKSDALLMAALKYVHIKGYAALILRRTFTDLALEGAIMDRSKKWLRNSDAVWEAQEKRWRFPSGATLTFGYLEHEDDKLRYQSAEFQFIGLDELTQFSITQYTYMFSRLRKASVNVPLRMRGATNPGGPSHDDIKARFGIPDEVDTSKIYEGPEGRRFHPAKLDDNPYVDKESYEQSLSQLDHVTRAQLKDGSWIRDRSTLVYAFDHDRDTIDVLPQLPSGMSWSAVLGIDYGNVNATSLVVMAFCLQYSETVFVLESQKWEGLDPTGAAKVVDDWSKRYGGFIAMVGDVGGLGKGYVEEARNRWGLPIEAAEKQNKYGYIKLINGAYENRKLKIITATNAPLIEELKKHHWKQNKQYIEEQPGSPNHAADAHLYAWRACVSWAHRSAPPTPPKHGTEAYYKAEAERMRQEAMAEADRDPFEVDPWAVND